MLLASAWPATAEIRINEVQSTNTGLPDPAGQLIDWVEIHNTAAAPVNLQGHYLSDSLSSRLKYQFPDVTLPAGGFLIIWAGSLGDFPNNRTPFHANFSISSGGEPVVLTAPDGTTIIDEYPALAIGTSNGTGRSMGRQPDGTGPLFFFNTPTQGAANTTAGVATETLAAPAFSVPGGPHTSSVSVSISTSVVGGTIRYTLDGSDPTESSPVYSGPLTLSSRTGEANLYAEIPTNYLDPGPPYYEGWQPPNGEVFKINVLRARVFKPNVAPSRITTQSYLVDPAGAARYPYPVVSIATTAANLFSDETGIYVPGRPDAWPKNYAQEGSAWERPGHIEFYEPDGTLGFQGEIGIRLHGNTTVSRPRKALRIYARNPAGPSTFNHQIFAEKEVDSFDTFLLRAGGNDWGQSIFRDALVSAIAAPTGLDRMSSRPAAVFIDGEYWGIHNVRDRIDEGYYFHHYGLTDAEFTQLEVPASAAGSWPVYDRGEPSLLADFEDILDRAWAGEFATPQGYAALTARIDIDNFIDYQVHEIWAGNTDWPGNNVRLWRAVTPDTQPGAHARHDGKWRWILFDADFALGLDFFYVPGFSDGPNHNTLAYASLTGGANFIGNSEQGTRLLRKTLENSEFRDKFINRFADLLNTSLSVSNATAKLDEFVSLYAPGMTEHVNRWRQPFNWTNDIGRIRNYLQQRPAAVRGHIAGRFGLPGMANLTVGVSDTNRGTITVNSIPLVPSTVGVSSNPYPWTGTYFQSVPVTVAANPKPGYRFVSWTDSGATNTNAVVNLATDSTANYASAWTNNTPNGGSGFNSWIFADTPSFDDGFFIGTSGRAIHASSPDGRSFGIYGHSGGSASASRGFAAGALQTNQSFSVTLSPGGFSGTKGVAVGAAGTNYFSFYAASFSGSPRYYVRDGTNGQVRLDALFSPEANKTFNFSATRLSNNVHRIVISSGSTTFVTNANLGGTIDRAVFFHTNSASSSDTNNLYFNQPRITQPGTNNGGVVQLFDPVVEVSLTTARTLTAEFEPEPASALALGGAASWTLGFTNAPLEVRAVNLLGDTDVNFTGTITLTIAGPGGFNQSFSATALEGVATFAAVDLPAGSYTLTATSGSLATGAPAAFLVKDAAVFLPTVTASWHVATNWDIASVPNSAAARVLIPANALTNRDVTLSAPATVASLGFDQGGSAFRNRVNGAAGSPLTFQATNGPATINVGGIGAGHANIEVSGGAVLLSDTVLDVQNISSTNAEYGALRLQGNWSGAGRMIKRGPGMAGITGAGKTFSGDIIIEQGVLTFSEPALTGNSVTSYTVQAGGQLRLSSAGAPRNYLLQGPLNLAGSGRSGVPEDENLGVLGALRLETGGTGTIAVLTNPVHLSSSADIHAPAGNAIQLQGPLTGSSLLTKSGGGTLTLDAGASVFGGGLAVNRGAVVLNGASITNTNTLSLAPETSLGGQGRWGGLLEVQGGGTLAFALGTSPSPAPPLRAGSLVVSGPAGVSLNVATNTLAGNYPLLAVDGSLVGTNNLALTAVPPAFPASRLVFSNQTLYVDLRASLGEREEWLEFHGLPVDGSGDGADDADPDRDGLDNVIERAFFLSPVLADGSLPVSTAHPSTDAVVVTYRVAKNQGDLTVTPETRPDLQPGAAWNAATPMVVDDTHPDYTVYQVELPAGPGAGFLRFRVTRL
jgi:autotransporter-associated beta strand protein